jgi:indole-3-glycerol phosphate synthase
MTILDEICAHKLRELEDRQERVPPSEIERRATQAAPARAFAPKGKIGLIAEVKRRSPSKGDFVQTLDPVAQARAYEHGGADAISVLTDARYFGGSFQDLEAVRAAVSLPVLCKDFILTEYQVHEARAHGADLLLLIVAVMNDQPLFALHECALALGMTPLVEVHDQHDLARALALGARLIGINNRDLTDFSVDLLTTEYLAPLIPDDVVVISESGIATRADVERVVRAGARGVLVGETLMRSDDPSRTVRELVG